MWELTRASDAGDGNIIGPGVDGKVLQRVTVKNRKLGVGDGELESVGVILRVMLETEVADQRYMENAVQQVRGPVRVQGRLGDGITATADSGEG